MKTNSCSMTRTPRLNKPQGVRKLLARLIDETLSGKLEPDLLRAVTYSCSMILKSLEIGELSDRLDRIEESLGAKK